ncbi:MAG: hypoxanthine phosphoribosyltransferase [Clostridium sp.]|nr:hypoxanthine phosphoribosyltransferase [Clostridium sp.]
MKQVTYKGLTFEPYIEYARIEARIQEIADQITAEFRGMNPLILCVLNGAFPFAADLFRDLDTDAEIAFIRLKSYEGTSSTGAVKEVLGLTAEIENRPVIIVEDIIDTGTTMVNLVRMLEEKHPSAIRIATLLFKPESLRHPIRPDYIGFSIPPKFIIGFGLDLDGMARNLRDIWVLSECHDQGAPAPVEIS